MDNKTFVKHLEELEACSEAVDWVKQHGGTAQECWNDCQRGDWMNWLIATDKNFLGLTKQQIVGALADIASLVLKYYEAKYPNDKRARDCINTCKRYSKGKATEEELEKSADAAYAAYTAAYATYTANAANAAAYAATYAKNLAKCADILRKHFPSPFQKG